MISIIYYIVFLLFTVLFFIPFTVLFFLTVLFDKERVLVHHASRLWAKGIYRSNIFWSVRTEGKERVDRTQPYLIVTNHQAMLDIPLMYVIPLNFKWVSKKEVQRIPIFGWVLWMHGDIAIERGASRSAREMIKKADERLKNGTSVIMFPEGTRSKDGEIGRFKEGAFLAARHSGVGILPVVHEGNGSVLKGWQMRTPHKFRVRILDPISAEEVANTPVKELTARVEELMRREHQALRGSMTSKK